MQNYHKKGILGKIIFTILYLCIFSVNSVFAQDSASLVFDTTNVVDNDSQNNQGVDNTANQDENQDENQDANTATTTIKQSEEYDIIPAILYVKVGTSLIDEDTGCGKKTTQGAVPNEYLKKGIAIADGKTLPEDAIINLIARTNSKGDCQSSPFSVQPGTKKHFAVFEIKYSDASSKMVGVYERLKLGGGVITRVYPEPIKGLLDGSTTFENSEVLIDLSTEESLKMWIENANFAGDYDFPVFLKNRGIPNNRAKYEKMVDLLTNGNGNTHKGYANSDTEGFPPGTTYRVKANQDIIDYSGTIPKLKTDTIGEKKIILEVVLPTTFEFNGKTYSSEEVIEEVEITVNVIEPPLVDTVEITIPENTTGQIKENIEAEIVNTSKALNLPIEFSFAKNNNDPTASDYFVIDPQTGAISVKEGKILDYENKKEYNLRIIVSSEIMGQKISALFAFNVYLTDVEEKVEEKPISSGGGSAGGYTPSSISVNYPISQNIPVLPTVTQEDITHSLPLENNVSNYNTQIYTLENRITDYICPQIIKVYSEDELLFKDTDQSNYFYNDIVNIAMFRGLEKDEMNLGQTYEEYKKHGVVLNVENFEPYRNVTRAEFVKMLVRSLSCRYYYIGTNTPFSDVDSHSWYAEYINFAVENGWINGYSDGTFRPNNPITREEASKILARAIKLDVSSSNSTVFVDLENNSEFIPYIETLRKSGVIDGYENSAFSPKSYLPRTEISRLIYRTFFGGKI